MLESTQSSPPQENSIQHTKVGLEKGTEIATEPIVVLVPRDPDKTFVSI
jgi:hypothetical protein